MRWPISAIPPFNGFVSEWFTYQSLFNAAMQGDKAVMIVAVFAAVALAITGALAVTCFVKAYGVSFASAPRSEAAANAKEVPAPMVFAQGPARGHLRRAGYWRSRDRARAGRCRRVRAASVRWRVCRRGHGAHEPVLRRRHLHAAIAIALVVLVGLACGYRKAQDRR